MSTAPKAVTTGMKDSGIYDQHSTPQWNSIAAVLPWLEEELGRCDLPPRPETLICADFGCSEGRNSIAAMQRIVTAMRRRTDRPIQTVHSDLATNNFNQLHVNLSPQGHAAFPKPQVYSASVGGSMYQQLLPPRTVAVATTFNALGWLSRVPTAVPQFVLARPPRTPRPGVGVSAEAQAAFAAQSAKDLTQFYLARAAEMLPGGLLLAATFGAGPTRSVIDGLYDAFNDALLDLLAAGRLSRAAYENFVMPLFMRTVEELTAPVNDSRSPVSQAFRLLRAETQEIPIELNLQFAESGDAAAWAAGCTNFLRAFTEPVLSARIAEAAGQQSKQVKPEPLNSLLDEIYSRFQARLTAEPQRYQFMYIQVAALLRRL